MYILREIGIGRGYTEGTTIGYRYIGEIYKGVYRGVRGYRGGIYVYSILWGEYILREIGIGRGYRESSI